MKKYEENLIWILDIETCKGFFTFSFSPLLHNYEETVLEGRGTVENHHHRNRNSLP